MRIDLSGRCSRMRPVTFMSLVKICAVVAILGSGVGLGSRPARANEAFPGYNALCGFPLLVASTPTVSLAAKNRAGQPVIVLDPILETNEEAHRRTFLIAHECAHHRMGHVSRPSRRKRASSRQVVRDHEMSADCWAAETLARAGMDRVVRIMADRFFRAGFYSPGGGYPSGLQRSTIIRECALIGRRARSTKAGAAQAGAD